MKKIFFLIFGIIIIVTATIVAGRKYLIRQKPIAVNDFDECASAGYPILESYPQQCRAPDGRLFTEDIGNVLAKQDLIRISVPAINGLVKSPLEIRGEARGYWFFEASFPIKLLDASGEELGTAIAQAQSDWMTENFVPFEARLEFRVATTKKGILVLEKDNPSDIPQNNDELIVPVRFDQ